MKKLRMAILAACAGLMMAACSDTPQTNYDRLFRPQGVEYYHVPIGLCEDYPEETTTLHGIRKDMEFLKQTSIDLLRISFGWDAIEAQEGTYDWLFWDDFVKMAVEEYGITLVPYICYVPRWNSSNAADSVWFWNYPPLKPEKFGEFMKQLVTRYKKYIKTWELWNEPDIWVYWQGPADQFAEMIRIGAKAVKEADPTAKVVLGGVAYSEEFVARMFRDYGLSPHIDIVNMHNYYETWSERPVEQIDDHILKMSEVIKEHGNQQPIWMAEVGYSTFRQGAKVSSEYKAYYDYEHTPEYQAVDLFKRLSLIVSAEKISAVAWYEISDLPASDEVIGDEYNNRHLGVAFINYVPKPARQALKFFNSLFASNYKNVTAAAEISKPENSDSETLVFQLQDGSAIVVNWLKTCVYEKRSADSTGSVKDGREETLAVTLPMDLKGEAVAYDHLGTRNAYAGLKRESGKTILDQIELTGGMISIIKVGR